MSTTLQSMHQSTHIALVERAKERFNKYEYRIDSVLPEPYTFTERVAIGTFSLTTPKKRFLLRSVVSSEVVGLPQTPPEIARDYLDLRFPNRIRYSREQDEENNINCEMPLYYKPSILKHGVYVDLVGAYWQLMNIIGWDVDYLPGKFLAPGRAPYDFLAPTNKLARNCLVTAGFNHELQIWTGHSFKMEKPYNVHYNAGLYRAISDLLHMFARAAVNLGAVYVNTDGYIINVNRLPELLGYFQRFNLTATIKAEGDTFVCGVGSYDVGNLRTKRFDGTFDAPFNNIRPSIANLDAVFLQISKDRIDRQFLFRR